MRVVLVVACVFVCTPICVSVCVRVCDVCIYVHMVMDAYQQHIRTVAQA